MEPIRLKPMELGQSLDVRAPFQGAPSPAGGPTAPFAQLLSQAVSTANEASKHADSLTTAMAQGQPVDLHRVVLAQQEAQISFDLVLQMRDKLVSAYQEVMRMPL